MAVSSPGRIVRCGVGVGVVASVLRSGGLMLNDLRCFPTQMTVCVVDAVLSVERDPAGCGECRQDVGSDADKHTRRAPSDEPEAERDDG